MSYFKKIKVKDIRQETSNAISVAFEIPTELSADFKYKSGQYITIKQVIDGEDVRRSYSLSSAPNENDFRIAVKKIEGGKMSSFLNETLKVGEEVEIMTPSGNFLLTPENEKHYVGFAAGSGITPVISMIKEVLLTSNSKFTLLYGNKSEQSTIFKKEIDQLVADNNDRFNVLYVYSKQESSNKLFKGRITKEKFEKFVRADISLLKADGFFLCGPEQMINEVSEGLKYLGVNKDKIHFELFTTPITDISIAPDTKENIFSGTSQVTVIMDGEEVKFELNGAGETILDASINHGVDAPFSCKGAVCCTCKAQIIEGKATMEMNYSLSDAEVEEGFILTCQAHPASEKLVVDYDVI